MVKLAIRDDDVSFFTHSEDVLSVYEGIDNFPISYAVVTYMLTNSYGTGNCPELKGNTTSRWIGDNLPLVETLKKLMEEKRVEIILHGFTHEYRKVGNKILPEFMWRTPDDCAKVISEGKKHLEEVFGVEIKWFVAPSNQIRGKNFQSIIDNGMNYSGLIAASFNRPKTVQSIRNYLFRFGHRLFHSFGYPGVLDYGTHKEVYACPIVDGNYLYKMFDYCKESGNPMVVNSHYWDIRDNANSRRILFDFIRFAVNNGAKPCLISELL